MNRHLHSRRTFLASLSAFIAASGAAGAAAQDGEQTPEPTPDLSMQVYDIPALTEGQERPFNEFLRIPEMSLGIYKLPADGHDTQSPHREPEAYYVLSGRASIEVEGERQSVQEGSLIFVPAQANHRFVDIIEDLDLLVIFAPAFNSTAAR